METPLCMQAGRIAAGAVPNFSWRNDCVFKLVLEKDKHRATHS